MSTVRGKAETTFSITWESLQDAALCSSFLLFWMEDSAHPKNYIYILLFYYYFFLITVLPYHIPDVTACVNSDIFTTLQMHKHRFSISSEIELSAREQAVLLGCEDNLEDSAWFGLCVCADK